MCTGSRLAKSRALADWLDLHIDGVRWPSDDRSVLAAGCLDTALEHHRAVVFLIENRLYGSAFLPLFGQSSNRISEAFG